jgi:hypothetical protein
METKVKDLTVVEFQSSISDTMRAILKDLIEDVSELSSPEYLESIEEARNDYREGSAGWIYCVVRNQGRDDNGGLKHGECEKKIPSCN